MANSFQMVYNSFFFHCNYYTTYYCFWFYNFEYYTFYDVKSDEKNFHSKKFNDSHIGNGSGFISFFMFVVFDFLYTCLVLIVHIQWLSYFVTGLI